ncbi:MAG TPA: EVE domain-containing protein [Stellaceae bacterium]|nr:EVE domain-containing protein [Stellaceae bacterium]
MTNYWVLKSEPYAYSWDQLVKDGRTHWNGVRNNQAALYLKGMKLGDRAFFYHSNEGLAIVGIVEVVREAYPDPGDRDGRFSMVDVRPVMAVKRPVTLKEIKADPDFADLALVRHSRLSVGPVSATHWKKLCALAGVSA